jgi:hypothetical protein
VIFLLAVLMEAGICIADISVINKALVLELDPMD